MSNFLKVSMKENIQQLSRQGLSIRRIAHYLNLNRRTVSKYIRGEVTSPVSCSTKVPLGSVGSKCTSPEGVPLGSVGSKCTSSGEVPLGSVGSKCTSLGEVPLGSECSNSLGSSEMPIFLGVQSACAPYSSLIARAVETGLSAQRIYQDLYYEYGFTGSYDSVKRFVRKLKVKRELPFRRVETSFGEEAQADYVSGYWLHPGEGRSRKVHILRVTLSASRKSYSEGCLSQSTENFIRGLENAFRYFGGSPKVLVIDNLKAGVIRPDLYDPELNPKLRSFASHYNCSVLPNRPYTPRHKGKVENGMNYIQCNALKGKKFPSLRELNEYLLHWESRIADQRIHGTLRRQVRSVFEEERAHLQALPPMLFEVFEEYKRKVHRDGHIEVCGSYYSVPAEYVRREVWVRYTTRTVRIYNERMQQIAFHSRVEKGRFSTRQSDIPEEKISNPERGSTWLLKRIDTIGKDATIWACSVLKNRGVEGIRVLNGLLQLAKKYKSQEILSACRQAHEYGNYYLSGVRKHLENDTKYHQPKLQFTVDHPLIRSMEQYEHIINSKEVFNAKCND